MNWYAYCVTEEPVDALDQVQGISGNRPFSVPCHGLHAVVGETPDARVAVTADSVRRHQSVIDHVLDRTTPLSFRFGQVLEPECLVGYIQARSAELAESLARVRGAVEMSVKAVRRRVAGPEPTPDAGEVLTPGRRYLAEKRAALERDASWVGLARDFARWLDEELGDIVWHSDFEVRTGEAFARLRHRIGRGRVDEYRHRIRCALDGRTGMDCVVSGPWPPAVLDGGRLDIGQE